MAIPKLLTR